MGEVQAAREALGAGLALVRTAWRDAWAPLLVSTAGWTALSAAGHTGLPPDSAAALAGTGLALVLLMTGPKLGALHRLAAGRDACDPACAAGLQWTAVETRLVATATALAAFAVLLALALGAAAAAALSADALLLAPLMLVGGAAVACVVGRLAVTLAADAAEPGPRFARGWLLTRGAGAAPAAVWLVTFAGPLAGVFAAQGALDALSTTGGRWGAAEAVAAGAVLAALMQFGLAPLNAGALAALRRAGIARERAAEAVDTPGALGDKARGPRPAASPPELVAP